MKPIYRFAPLMALALVAACSSSAPLPTTPSSAVGGSTAATGPDGSTLKITAPALIDPVQGVKLDDTRPTLVWSNAYAKYGGVGVAYDLEIELDGKNVYSRTVGETVDIGSHLVDLILDYDKTYFWRARARVANDFGPWSAWEKFLSPSKPVPVAPPPGAVATGGGCAAPLSPLAAGQTRKPKPNDFGVVAGIAAANPGDFSNSCQPEGGGRGNWNFMDKTVDALRALDGRYGYNCKRGNCNDPSLDVISYYWGSGASIQGSTQVYIFDLIGGHCGSNPSVIWNDVTDITFSSGTVGATIFPRPGRVVAPCTTTTTSANGGQQ
jgi:hypothetical protein